MQAKISLSLLARWKPRRIMYVSCKKFLDWNSILKIKKKEEGNISGYHPTSILWLKLKFGSVFTIHMYITTDKK